MGNISNLATTGIYTFEKDTLKVTFNFVINNETKAITRIDSGVVNENEINLATFSNHAYAPKIEGAKMLMNLARGREVELATAITEAIAQFEGKVKEGAI